MGETREKHWVVKVFGWMTIVDASTKREAVMIAKGLACSASLLRSDVTEHNVSLATDADIEWFKGMLG